VLADRSAPVLTRLRIVPRRFRRGDRLPRLQATRAKRRGAQIRFTLSEPARVRFSLQRIRRGHHHGLPGTFAVAAPAGAVRLRFQGPLTARRPPAPGRYRLIARPVDRAGNTGRARHTDFRLLAPRRARGAASHRTSLQAALLPFVPLSSERESTTTPTRARSARGRSCWRSRAPRWIAARFVLRQTT
jgi:hypothetical protein